MTALTVSYTHLDVYKRQILGVVLSEDVITRQANFLHNPDRVLHMLRSQSALEVKEQHKACLLYTSRCV